MIIEISTDGSAYPNPGPGGWACIFRVQNQTTMHIKTLYGFDLNTTNNRMELTAAIRALEHLTRPCQVKLYTDSEYLVNGITKWIKRWKRSNFQTLPFEKHPPKEILNKDLWLRLDQATLRHQIEWTWVRGHDTHGDNNLCDSIAARASHSHAEGSADLSHLTSIDLSFMGTCKGKKKEEQTQQIIRAISFQDV